MLPHALTLNEVPLPGPVPRFEIPGWRERYGVVAGITSRGGLAAGERGFDLGLWTDAPVGEVMARWRAFRSAEPGFHATVLGHQVHGRQVAWYPDARGWELVEGVDGHATAAPGVLLCVTVADCIPVYLALPGGVALLHAGWRGTARGILARGVELLCTAVGAPVRDIAMHCGVGICGRCYEVGSEVMEGCGLKAEGPAPWRVDLRERLAEQARGLGIVQISTSQLCSGHDRPTFYSHRASRGRDGRMVAYLGRPDPDTPRGVAGNPPTD